jgi:hypothetical protein
MKLPTVAALAVLFSAGYALAGAGAPVPEGSQKAPPSGRPGKILSDAECQTVWKMASPGGATLSEGKATPYVLNFHMVDTTKDGTISADEFKAGCAQGWIQSAAAATTKHEGHAREPII